MPETCRYCDTTVEDEAALRTHLREAHDPADLGPIDRRRIEGGSTDDASTDRRTVIAVGGVAVLGIAAIGLGLRGSGGDGEPSLVPGMDDHGTMVVEIDGEELDLSGDQRFINNHQVFHFHGGEYDQYGAHVWHVHGEGVTLTWALATLGIELEDAGSVVHFDGETYDAADTAVDVSITVNGDPVDPDEHELEGVGPMGQAAAGAGDDVALVVTVD